MAESRQGACARCGEQGFVADDGGVDGEVCVECATDEAVKFRADLEREREAHAETRRRLDESERQAAGMRDLLRRWVESETSAKGGGFDVNETLLAESEMLLASSDAGRGWVSPEEHERVREALRDLHSDVLRECAGLVRAVGRDDWPDDAIPREPVVEAALRLKTAADELKRAALDGKAVTP